MGETVKGEDWDSLRRRISESKIRIHLAILRLSSRDWVNARKLQRMGISKITTVT